VFTIEFISSEPELQDEGDDPWYALWGRVTLGDYWELFLASLSLWTRADYERQWREAATRLVAGETRSAFCTSALQFWWVMWRDGSEIRVHEELLTPERLASVGAVHDTRRAPYELIRPYASVTDDGHPISEWRLSVTDIENFLRRLPGH